MGSDLEPEPMNNPETTDRMSVSRGATGFGPFALDWDAANEWIRVLSARLSPIGP
jgi:hypothetical protein